MGISSYNTNNIKKETNTDFWNNQLKEREEAEQFYEPVTEEEEYEDSIITYEDAETDEESSEETVDVEVQ